MLQTKYNRGSFAYIWDLGLGTLGPYNLMSGWAQPTSKESAIVATVLIANLPQALLSLLYFMVNALVTNLSLADEWSRYACRRAALRVSQPRGSQRSTYFLQIPYRIAIPLMMFSTSLHWLISQSIFLAKVDGKNAKGGDNIMFEYVTSNGASTITCGYSPLGMVMTVIIGFMFGVFTVALGMRKLKPGIPLAGSCSAAISAACHSPRATSECEPVMWGVIPGDDFVTEDRLKVGHCALSNDFVEFPVEERMYA